MFPILDHLTFFLILMVSSQITYLAPSLYFGSITCISNLQMKNVAPFQYLNFVAFPNGF
jgi:hypothetical protein